MFCALHLHHPIDPKWGHFCHCR